MSRRCRLLVILALAVLGGCNRPAETATPSDDPPAIGTRFVPADCGAVAGQVHWAGVAPEYARLSAAVAGPDGKVTYRQFPNPNAPQVNLFNGSVHGAVIFLEGVEPARARPWDYPPVRVAVTTEQIRVQQGQAVTNTGFVRAGEEVEFESRDAALHVVSARGAAFFGLPLPDAGQPLRRRFAQPGLVELSSGAARCWHRAYLWVGAHPYFAMTAADGRFQIANVPSGEYRLVAWLPNADLAGVDRDPNTGMILRHHYAEPLRVEWAVHVDPGRTSEVDFWLSK